MVGSTLTAFSKGWSMGPHVPPSPSLADWFLIYTPTKKSREWEWPVGLGTAGIFRGGLLILSPAQSPRVKSQAWCASLQKAWKHWGGTLNTGCGVLCPLGSGSQFLLHPRSVGFVFWKEALCVCAVKLLTWWASVLSGRHADVWQRCVEDTKTFIAYLDAIKHEYYAKHSQSFDIPQKALAFTCLQFIIRSN